MSASPAAIAALRKFRAGQDLTVIERALLVAALAESLENRTALSATARRSEAEALAAMRSQHFAGMTPSGAAKAIAKRLADYASAAYLADRAAAAPPRSGTLKRACFDVLSLGDGTPPAWRTVLRRLPTLGKI